MDPFVDDGIGGPGRKLMFYVPYVPNADAVRTEHRFTHGEEIFQDFETTFNVISGGQRRRHANQRPHGKVIKLLHMVLTGVQKSSFLRYPM